MDLSALPTAGELSRLGACVPRWSLGVPGARHSEVFAPGTEGSGAAAALALALDGVGGHARFEELHLLWVQDAVSLRLNGRPYRPGLPRALRPRVIHVVAANPEDALFALEEGVRCRDFACVVGEITGNPKALDFTASRRLTLAAEKHGVSLCLVRFDADPDLSSARMRWRVHAAPSLPPRWNAQAPGAPAWHAELFRARGHAPGEWILRDDGQVLAAERFAAPEAGAPDHGDLAGAAGA